MKKIFIGSSIFILVLLIAAGLFPFLFKDKIIQAAKEAANKELNATLNFGDLDVSLLQNIKHFPDITLVVYQPSIVGKNQFQGDTLIKMDKLLLALDIQSIFQTGNPMKINAVDIIGADINAKVDTGGVANWDIMLKKDEKTESSKFSLDIQKINLENINVLYKDLQSNQSLEIIHFQHKSKGNFSDNIVHYISETDIDDLSFFKGMIPYLKNVHLKNESDIEIDQSSKRYTLSKNHIQLNELNLILDGTIQQLEKDALNLQLNFNTENNDFKQILSLIPVIYKTNFKEIKTSGQFDLKGKVDGLYKGNIYPKMDIVFNIRNGEFQYPSLPKKVSNIHIASNIKSTGGTLDNMVVDVSKFSMLLGSDPFEGNLKLSQLMSNPYIELYSKGRINLADIQKFYPMDEVKKMEGLMHLDLNIKAKKSDIQAKNYQAIIASGVAEIKGLIYESKSVEKPLRISDITLNFSPQFVDLTSCVGTIGASDFNLKGKLENFIGYYLSKEEVMKGTIQLISQKIDMNEFTSENKEKKNEYVMVPRKLDFSGSAMIKEMKYGKMTIQNIVGGMNVRDEKILLNDVSADLLGGKAKIDAIYSTVGQSKPVTTVQYDIESFDMTQVYNYMESAPKLAPIMQFMTGKLSSVSNLSMSLLPDMSPDLNTLNGDFAMSIPFAKITNVPALNQIVQVTKLNQLSNLEAKDIKAKMSFVNGKMVLQPTNFKANNYNIGLSGLQGLDKSIDYKMSVDVPFAELGNATGVVNGLISKFNLPFIGSINPESVRLHLNIKGFFDKPQVSLGAPDILTGGKATDAKTLAVDAVKKTGEDLKNQAIKKADSFKNAAVNEAQKKADELKKQAEDKANELKKKAEDEVNKKKDDLLNELKKKLPW